MSGLFGSITIKGNRITDFAQQTGTVGIPIPFGYGVIVCDGNVTWTSKVTTHVKKKKQGKGGVKTEEYTYTRSYAIAFCQGRIFGYLTITRNGKVVYTTDPRTTVEDRAYATKWAQNAALYFGTADQMPDSTIEAVVGAGQVSAHRDLAYIVVENDDVTDGSGAIPSYQAIILASPPLVFMTSRPYPIEDISGLGGALTAKGGYTMSLAPEGLTTTLAVLGGNLFGSLETYSNYPAEAFDTSLQVLGGNLFGSLETYNNYPAEGFNTSLQVLGGEMYGDLVTYSNYPAEGFDTALEALGGTLE